MRRCPPKMYSECTATLAYAEYLEWVMSYVLYESKPVNIVGTSTQFSLHPSMNSRLKRAIFATRKSVSCKDRDSPAFRLILFFSENERASPRVSSRSAGISDANG